MKRRTIFSIALVMSIIFVSLMSSDSPANAQQQQGGGGIFNSGIVTLGPNQVLRIIVTAGDLAGDNNILVRFRQMGYIEQQNIFRSTFQSTGNPIQLAPGEGASIDISGVEFNAVRGIVQVNTSRGGQNKPTVIGQIIDAPTGTVQGIIAILIG